MRFRNSKYFVLSALILSLAFNFPLQLGFLVFIFLLPIIIVLERKMGERFVKKEILNVLIFGLLFSFLSTLWFYNLYPLAWQGVDDRVLGFIIVFGLWIILAFFLTIPIIAWYIFSRFIYSENIYLNIFNLSFAWVLMEHLRSYIIYFALYSESTLFGPHHTYYSLGYLTPTIPYFKNLIPVGGMYLAVFFVIFVNVFLFNIFEIKANKNKSKKNDSKISRSTFFLLLFLFASIVIANIYITHLRNNLKNVASEEFVNIGNSHFPSSSKKEDILFKGKITYEKILEIGNENEFYLLPENLDITNFYKENKSLLKNNIFIIGTRSNKNENMYYINSSKQNIIPFYEKKLLMPIGEYQVDLFSFFTSFYSFHNSKLPNLSIGKKTRLLQKDYIIFSSSICSENISPNIFREDVLNGANVIINLSSLGPFKNSRSLSDQTIAISTVRALETGRYYLAATNYNESFIISDTGNLIYKSSSQEMNKIEFSKQKFVTKNYLTPYTLFGDWIILISILFIIAFNIAILKTTKTNTKL